MSRGRPQFQPTPEQRSQCAILSAGRVAEADIAAVFGITRPTLHKHFAAELTQGAAQRNAAVLLALEARLDTPPRPLSAERFAGSWERRRQVGDRPTTVRNTRIRGRRLWPVVS